MELVKIDQCSLHYGEQVLMDGIELSISKGQRICLVGRNGTGKSTLLKMISGSVKPDSGTVWLRQGLRVAYLEQELPLAEDVTTYDVVASAFSETGQHLMDYHRLSMNADNPKVLQQLTDLQQKIEAADGWQLPVRWSVLRHRLGSVNLALTRCCNKLVGSPMNPASVLYYFHCFHHRSDC